MPQLLHRTLHGEVSLFCFPALPVRLYPLIDLFQVLQINRLDFFHLFLILAHSFALVDPVCSEGTAGPPRPSFPVESYRSVRLQPPCLIQYVCGGTAGAEQKKQPPPLTSSADSLDLNGPNFSLQTDVNIRKWGRALDMLCSESV